MTLLPLLRFGAKGKDYPSPGGLERPGGGQGGAAGRLHHLRRREQGASEHLASDKMNLCKIGQTDKLQSSFCSLAPPEITIVFRLKFYSNLRHNFYWSSWRAAKKKTDKVSAVQVAGFGNTQLDLR